MKRFILICIMLALVGPGFTQAVEKFVPRKEKARTRLQTAEPGTYLKPAAHSFLENYSKAIENETRIKTPSKKLIRFFSRKQALELDTLISMDGQQLPLRIYYPTRACLKEECPVILFFHGGGFIYGSIDDYHMMVCKLAKVSGMPIISVEYRLAPQHPYPAAARDCLLAYRWLRKNGSQLGLDTCRICLMGDSAGGNLASVVTLMCRDLDIEQPYRQVLVYPAASLLQDSTVSMRHFALESDRSYMLTERFMRKVLDQYLGDQDPHHPYVSPIEDPDLGYTAPTLLITAECDPLRDCGRAYAHLLEEAGVPVDYYEYSGMIHGFLNLHPFFKEGTQAMELVRDFLAEN